MMKLVCDSYRLTFFIPLFFSLISTKFTNVCVCVCVCVCIIVLNYQVIVKLFYSLEFCKLRVITTFEWYSGFAS